MGRGRGQGARAQAEIGEFARELAELKADAGDPSGPQLCRAAGAGLSTSGISELLRGKRGEFGIPQWETVRAFVGGCRAHAASKGIALAEPLGDVAHWRKRHGELVKTLDRLDRDGPVLPPFAPLPAVPPGFTGRGADLEELLAVLTPAAGDEQAVLVASVHGMGGMGKTTLGLAAGHAAVRRGLFTGVLLLDLHGYDDNALDPGQVLDTALRALGTAPEQIPPDPDQRAALYRTQLDARARAGERVLVLADNASGADQVHHLVPPPGAHRLLVTSRDDFAAVLDAHLIDLDVLTPERAAELLDTALRLTLPQDARITADPDGAARLADLCGRLPLALRIAAAQLAADRSLRPARLADELDDLTERLDLLDDGSRAVRSVLERSYRRLAPTHAEVFRLLAVNPGPDLSLDAAAAATGISKTSDVRRRLVALSRASLIRQDPGTGRWRMHDLVRAYAGELAREHPGHTAVAFQRLLTYYCRLAAAADADLQPTRIRKDHARQYADWTNALAIMDAERANITAAAHAGREAGHHHLVVLLAMSFETYCDVRRHLKDSLAVAQVALASAQDSSDRLDEASAWDNLGVVLRGVGRFEEAEQAHRNALALWQDVGDRRNEVVGWGGLGIVLREMGRFEEAERAFRAAMSLNLSLGRHNGGTAHNLGLVLEELGRFEEAEQAHRTALAHNQALGDYRNEAGVWHNLGTALRSAGDMRQAVDAGRRAVTIFRELGDQYRLGWASDELADTLLAAGHPAAEVRALREESAAAYRLAGAEEKAVAALAKADGPGAESG
ncbi:tetratricopeptide repeat protein [Kitasatospora sp. NPDC090308]|uniref:tetratricopeptide repeat protein n=1 Tax=Kitasatospora sp. NPDC090308 TaxID=3364082 RepID=UPI0037F3F692